MIITDWTSLKQEIKITQDLLTFHPPQDKRVPVTAFYTFLMLTHTLLSYRSTPATDPHRLINIVGISIIYARIVLYRRAHSVRSNRADERQKIIFVRTRLLCFR